MTVHNMIDLGMGPRVMLASLGLSQTEVGEYFEFWDEVNCLKAALKTADVVTTVSATYAKEICASDEMSYKLNGVLNYDLKAPLIGIVNGMEDKLWSWNGLSYDGRDNIAELRARKQLATDNLLPLWRGDRTDPIIAFKSRWTDQSGIVLFADAAEEILEDARVICNVWGTP